MDKSQKDNINPGQPKVERVAVSLKTIASLVDAHRSSVRRWLREAGIKPIALGRGRNGGIRYRWRDIQNWLESHRMSSN